VNGLGEDEFARRFGMVFENSPWIAGWAWQERPFGSFSELHGAFVEAMYSAPATQRLALIRAHPDLAGKAAVEGELTPESTREQASVGLDRLTPEEYEAFTRMNREYRERFGFPMVVAVRDYDGKQDLLAAATQRLGRTRTEEIETALAEIARITRLRLQELIEVDPAEESTSKEASL
jgi:2-oxo-4-hydroxy-4-carboxy-5-ureidoimidazoline decarboxylase